jgi:DNA-binding NarL/FixJ family response regulator
MSKYFNVTETTINDGSAIEPIDHEMKETPKTDAIYDILTRREIEITKLIVNGCTDKEIAEQLHICFHTVRKHHQHILQKTNQKNMHGLMKFALNNGFNIDL